jgi:hypothetical protein
MLALDHRHSTLSAKRRGKRGMRALALVAQRRRHVLPCAPRFTMIAGDTAAEGSSKKRARAYPDSATACEKATIDSQIAQVAGTMPTISYVSTRCVARPSIHVCVPTCALKTPAITSILAQGAQSGLCSGEWRRISARCTESSLRERFWPHQRFVCCRSSAPASLGLSVFAARSEPQRPISDRIRTRDPLLRRRVLSWRFPASLIVSQPRALRRRGSVKCSTRASYTPLDGSPSGVRTHVVAESVGEPRRRTTV